MFEVRRTETFKRWLGALRDETARLRIEARIYRLSKGNAGDVKAVGEGVFELRVDHGPGYRVYFMRQAFFVVLLLIGGDKSTQRKDIAAAIAMAKERRR
ncbi:MAG: type II toxin-antitoxin system RelE/ParE family toxin [Mesorhizobium sp.]|nr:type II toxin-antitoxin system RelE/ParE family toxin [Mesorhizobium sp.]MCO5162573.1 type II toxin-antitoxin system RelE/ParE family toxin [Mesorhizobium sp.]